MAEASTAREELLRQEYHGQTARICWHDLQTYYAQGRVVSVAVGLSLVEVAVQLGMDNTAIFQDWIATDKVAVVDDQQALAWHESNEELWAVVAAPWVLVQSIAQ
ncbi:MAG: DUF2288 family protein [Halioglobus sp.]